jgi:hypothetical protein
VAGITVTLADAMTTEAIRTFVLNAGTLNLAGFTLTCGAFSSSNSSTRSISFGAGSIALIHTSAGSTILVMNQVTGFTYTGTGLFTRSMGATATVGYGSTSSSGLGKGINLDVTGGSSTLTLTSGSYFKNLNFTGNSSTTNGTTINVAGNLTLSSTGTYTSFSCNINGTSTITTNGKTFSALDINASGITATLADALTISGQLNLGQGTFTTANFNVTAGSFVSSSPLIRTLNMGSSAWVITSNTWNTSISTNMTLNAGTSSIRFNSSGVSKSFQGGGLSYYNLIHDSAGGGGLQTLTITGANTFNDITTNVRPSTIVFPASVTQTLANFTLSGTAGNLVTIQSSTSGTQFTLSKASGSVTVDYLSIKDSNATGGAVFTANNSVNGGNNTGWLGFAILANGNMLLMFL